MTAEEHRFEAIRVLSSAGMSQLAYGVVPLFTREAAELIVEHLTQAAAQTVLDILEAKEKLAKAPNPTD